MSPKADGSADAARLGRNEHDKLRSLLQLGELIGLDLRLDEMLLQIAKKATEVMEADRFSIFLYDAAHKELFTTVALGMGTHEIRIPADSGIAGYCLKTGETVILDDAQADPRLNRDVEARTGYRTENLLCMPLYSRSGRPLGVAQALNKTTGVFTREDGMFLRMFNNHAAVFIEMAQLQKARIEALEHSKSELERLNRVKSKAINHLSHELKTPIALIQANVRLLKNRFQQSFPDADWRDRMESLERHLKRLAEVQKEAGEIFRVSFELEAGSLISEMDRLEEQFIHFGDMTDEMHLHWSAVKVWLRTCFTGHDQPVRSILLRPLSEKVVRNIEERAPDRKVDLAISGDDSLKVVTNPSILAEVLEGLVKNAFENTPDGSRIGISFAEKEGKIYIQVKDCGIGITDENRLSLFDGLSPARDTELYASKRPYEFGAGGKGLDLLRMKLCAERFGFSLAAESSRCVYIPTDLDQCPGNISLCGHCRTVDDCIASGGSIFTVTFPVMIGDPEPEGQSVLR